eukprot:scaffold65448_cov64-Phaeocystis_antarctica.AAC.7
MEKGTRSTALHAPHRYSTNNLAAHSNIYSIHCLHLPQPTENRPSRCVLCAVVECVTLPVPPLAAA